NIFGVLASTGHAKRRAVNQIVMRQKNLFEFRRQSVLWRSSRSNRRHTLLGKQNSGRHQLLTGKSLSRMKCPPLLLAILSFWVLGRAIRTQTDNSDRHEAKSLSPVQWTP